MVATTIISKTDLARRTRHVLEQARRGRPMIVESYGEEQVAILDIVDYRILRAVAAYYSRPLETSPITDPSMTPRGLELQEVEHALSSEGDAQEAWNHVVAVYLSGDITLARSAELLGLSRFELADRFQRLGLPLMTGPATTEEAARESAAFRR